jgi:chemotaxis signal transduction protein
MSPLVLFNLADQQYGLDVFDVLEVVRLVTVTPLLEAPPEILGAINVRGRSMLVLDLRQRLGLPHRPPTSISPLLIVKSRTTKLAVLVDQVIGVTHEATAPNAGVARVGEKLIVMLRADDLPSERSLPLLAGLAS